MYVKIDTVQESHRDVFVSCVCVFVCVLQTASSGLTKLAEPRTILSLKLKNPDNTSEVVPMELTHDQMVTLLTQLDTAQQQLDAL